MYQLDAKPRPPIIETFSLIALYAGMNLGMNTQFLAQQAEFGPSDIRATTVKFRLLLVSAGRADLAPISKRVWHAAARARWTDSTRSAKTTLIWDIY